MLVINNGKCYNITMVVKVNIKFVTYTHSDKMIDTVLR